jgi:hypothetical protein
VSSRAVLVAVVKRKIPSPRRESNPRTPIVQPVAQRYADWAITALLENRNKRKYGFWYRHYDSNLTRCCRQVAAVSSCVNCSAGWQRQWLEDWTGSKHRLLATMIDNRGNASLCVSVKHEQWYECDTSLRVREMFEVCNPCGSARPAVPFYGCASSEHHHASNTDPCDDKNYPSSGTLFLRKPTKSYTHLSVRPFLDSIIDIQVVNITWPIFITFWCSGWYWTLADRSTFSFPVIKNPNMVAVRFIRYKQRCDIQVVILYFCMVMDVWKTRYY